MKKVFLLFFLALYSIASAKTYFVSVDGNDANPGSLTQPFATWQKGFTIAVGGDTVFIRGGIYYPTGVKDNNGYYCGVVQHDHDGTQNDPIVVWAFPGETPVLDCRTMIQTGSHLGIYFENCDYWHLKGLSVTRADQGIGYGAAGIKIYSGNNLTLENITSHHNGGSGIQIIYNSENNILLNCDAYGNYDPYSTPPGEHADGIEIADIKERNGNERVNKMKGCRSWDNGDDGFDHFRCDGILMFDQCWAGHNGYIPGTETRAGNGVGFKLGMTFGTPESIAQRVVSNCISYDNRTTGFSQEEANVKMIFLNNIAYANTNQAYIFTAYNTNDVLRNNISYKNGSDGIFRSNQTIDHNSWQNGLIVSDADFLSLDGSQLTMPRKADGSLPDITFMHLASESDLIDAGADVGLPFHGSAPDIGAFEIPTGEFHLNQLPVVSISSPLKGISFTSPATVTIDIEANDPDGNITKVELFNGSVKLDERTTAPYSFTLKDLPEGSYSLKAVATDNLKATTISSSLDLQVTSAYNENREYFNLYPNPNDGRFSIDFTTTLEVENYTVTIVDLIGKTVYQQKLSNDETIKQFDLSDLKCGIYVIMISSNQILLTQKFIKG